MPKYMMLDTGQICSATDPRRGIWMSSTCGYWTDDWSALKSTESGIPCCPHCGMVGMQTEAHKWFEGAKKYESQGHNRYFEFVNKHKGLCLARRGITWELQYQDWLMINAHEQN